MGPTRGVAFVVSITIALGIAENEPHFSRAGLSRLAHLRGTATLPLASSLARSLRLAMAGFLLPARGMTRNAPLLLLLGALSAACGGTTAQAPTSDSGISSTTDAGLAQDSGKDATAECPAEAPSQGEPCSTVGFQCQYGTNFFPNCSQIAECSAGGWQLSGPPSGCTSSQCPASYAALGDGGLQTCASSLQVTDCWYPQGVCQCSGGLGGPAQPLGWYCVPTVPGCPYPTPAPGSRCTTQGQICGGGCAGPSVECSDAGTWQASASICPV
jgi:hypothetical protein